MLTTAVYWYELVMQKNQVSSCLYVYVISSTCQKLGNGHISANENLKNSKF